MFTCQLAFDCVFGPGCYSIVIGGTSSTTGARQLEFGPGCYNISLKGGSNITPIYDCAFGSGCYNITWNGNGSFGLVFGMRCNDITFNSATNCVFGPQCAHMTFTSDTDRLVFGPNCLYITSDVMLRDSVFAPNCSRLNFTGRTWQYCTFGPSTRYVNFTCSAASGTCRFIDVKPGVNSTSTYKTITISESNQTHCTTIQPAGSTTIEV